MTSDVVSEKRALRTAAHTRRAELARGCPDFAHRIAMFAHELALPRCTRISGYRPLAGEADPSELLRVLAGAGHEISYPRVHEKGLPLWFHVPAAGEAFVTGAFGIAEPRPSWPRAFPTALFVPLLAFDAEGHRLGYGGGYYDRTFQVLEQEHPVAAIGVAFAGQEIRSVPHETHDRSLDMLVTEQGIRRFPRR